MHFGSECLKVGNVALKKRRPLLLVVENSLDFTGGLNSILRSSELLKDQFEFHFILPSNSKSTFFVKQKGFVTYEWPMKELSRGLMSIFIYVPFLFYNTFKLYRQVSRVKADLIVSNDLYNLLPPLYRIVGGQTPYVCYVRFLPSKFPVYLIKLWSWLHNQYASSIIAVSATVKQELPHRDKVIVIGNEMPDRNVDLVFSTTYQILYPANYMAGKGHEYALRCFANISAHHPKWKLRFVGSDMGLKKNYEYKKNLMEKASSLGLNNSVEWSGFSDEMEKEYLNAAIVLNFSESESFSLTCLEAMFYGRPVVATKSGGPQEIIEPDVSGILVNVNDVSAMSEALEDLILNPDKRNKMAQNAYWSVRKKFNLKDIKMQLSSVYFNGCGLKVN